MNKRLLMYAVFGEEYRVVCVKKDYVPDDKTVAQALDRLTEREKYVLECRFANSQRTLKQTAAGYPRKDGGQGVTQERCRQIEAKALRRLKSHNQWSNLWPGGREGNR